MATVNKQVEKLWQKKRRELRDQLWPDARDVVFCTPRDGGYCKAVPRIVSLASVLAAQLKQRAGDVTATYFDLWLRTDNDGFVEVDDELECAAAAGFLGGRALWSWRERIRELEKLGFIRVHGEGHRDIAYVLVLHPANVVAGLVKKHEKRLNKVWKDYYQKRTRDTGATPAPEPLF